MKRCQGIGAELALIIGIVLLSLAALDWAEYANFLRSLSWR